MRMSWLGEEQKKEHSRWRKQHEWGLKHSSGCHGSDGCGMGHEGVVSNLALVGFTRESLPRVSVSVTRLSHQQQ